MDNLTLPQQIERMDLDRLRAYSENLDFYNGAQWPGRPRRGERRLTFNYSRAFIDKVTSYLMVDTGFSIEPWDGSPEASEWA
ncbi:MAG: phage portal protein, partial [Chloroflexi bacterium]|nr:phage portal protein [Chloroflexota bacterium]